MPKSNLAWMTKMSEIRFLDENLCPKAERYNSNVRFLDILASLYSGMPKSERYSCLSVLNPNTICLNNQSFSFWHYSDFGHFNFGIPLYICVSQVKFNLRFKANGVNSVLIISIRWRISWDLKKSRDPLVEKHWMNRKVYKSRPFLTLTWKAFTIYIQ